jgi:CBS domain-containing protein
VAVTVGRPSEDTLAVVERLSAQRAPLDAVMGLADHYDSVTRDALAEAEHVLGEPPTPYAWLALGSHARREPSLASDQDNALVLASDDPDVVAYGQKLAAHVVDALHTAGLRRCDGDYMATTWAHSLADWEGILRQRFIDPRPQDVLDADVFLDLRPIAGDLDVSSLQSIMVGAAGSARLLQGLAAAAVQYPSGVGALGRLRLTGGKVDLKKGGLAPLTMIARTYSLASGSTAVGTRERLAAAEQAGQLSPRAAGRLGFAHALLTRLRLTHQLRAARAGEPITDLVAPNRIRWVDERLLRQAFDAIREVQQATALRFRTDLHP